MPSNQPLSTHQQLLAQFEASRNGKLSAYRAQTLLTQVSTLNNLYEIQQCRQREDEAISQRFASAENTHEDASVEQKKYEIRKKLSVQEQKAFDAYHHAIADYNRKMLSLVGAEVVRGPLDKHIAEVYQLGMRLTLFIDEMQKDKAISYSDAKSLLDRETTMIGYLKRALKADATAEERITLLEKAEKGAKAIEQFIAAQTKSSSTEKNSRRWAMAGLLASAIILAIGIACLVALTHGSIFGIAIVTSVAKISAAGVPYTAATGAGIGLTFGGTFGLALGATGIGSALIEITTGWINSYKSKLKNACQTFNKSLREAAEHTPQHTGSFFSQKKAANDNDGKEFNTAKRPKWI